MLMQILKHFGVYKLLDNHCVGFSGCKLLLVYMKCSTESSSHFGLGLRPLARGGGGALLLSRDWRSSS